MKKITKKDLKMLCDGDKVLTPAELKALTKIIDHIELLEYQPYSGISGGYADIEVTSYDDDDVSFELTAGVCDEDGNNRNTTQHTMARELLLKKISLKEKIAKIDSDDEE